MARFREVMNRWGTKSLSDKESTLSEEAEKLYEEAIKLSPKEQRNLALRLLANADVAPLRAASWETLDKLRRIVHLGAVRALRLRQWPIRWITPRL